MNPITLYPNHLTKVTLDELRSGDVEVKLYLRECPKDNYGYVSRVYSTYQFNASFIIPKEQREAVAKTLLEGMVPELSMI